MHNNLNNYLTKYGLTLAFFFSAFAMWGQDITMANGNFETCSAALLDSGAGGADYSNDEYFVFTICPDVEGDVINVDFSIFNLDQSGAQNTWDNLAIFDGDNLGANSLGVYTGNQLQGVVVQATPQNPTGCLTFEWRTNGTGTGNVAGFATCETPCDRPTAVATYSAEDDPLICVGEVVNFDGTGSFAAPGFSIASYEWVFGDGTTNTTTLTPSHAWDEPGLYSVELYLLDDNGCSSANLINKEVYVSTFPSWDPFPSDTTLCVGEQLVLEAFPDQYETTWVGAEAIFSNPQTIVLEDIIGAPNDSEIFVNGFQPGQTLVSADDVDITTIINHSFLFDLVISIECPSGQSILLHQQMQDPNGGTVGSNGTDLGVPDGAYETYTWSNSAPETWSQVATTGANTSLPPGDYASLEPMEGLVGCELNGTWTFTIIDNWGGDDGEMSEWLLEFNPEIIPDAPSFTPSIGVEIDSSFWTVPNTAGLENYELTNEGNTVSFLTGEEGSWDFTYELVNSHGCTVDSTITISAQLAAQADAGPDVTFCGNNTQLQGGLQGIPPSFCSQASGNYTYCYDNGAAQSFTYCPDNPGDGSTFIDITFNSGSVENFFDEFYVYDGDSNTAPLLAGPLYGDLSGLQFIATNPSGCLTIEVTPDGSVSCGSGSQTEWNYDVGCGAGGPDFVYSWQPVEGLSDPNIANPSVTSLNGTTTYTLTAFPEGRPDCASTDEMTVNPAFDFNMDFTPPSCNGNDAVIEVTVDETTGTGPWEIEFISPGQAPETVTSNGGTTLFENLLPGSYSASISAGGCSYTQDFVITGPPILSFETSNDTIICIGGIAPLQAWSDMDDDNSWTFTWDNGLGVGASLDASPTTTTTYEVFATDDFGCVVAPLQVTVEVYEGLAVEISAPGEVCSEQDVTLNVENTTGGQGANYFYEWSFDGSSIGSGTSYTNQESTSGEYCVTVTEGCETPAITECLIVNIEQDPGVAFEADTTLGCFPAAIEFTNLLDPTLITQGIWVLGDGNTQDDSALDMVYNHVYEQPGLYDVELRVRTPLGCWYDVTYPNYINVSDNPQVNFTADPQPATIPETEINFFESAEEGIVEYMWVFGADTLGVSTDPETTFQFPIDAGGIYPVTLTVTDAQGCTATEEKLIIINDLLNIYIPNSFTPNNDGINDLFQVQGTDIDPDRFTFQVFNAWGEKVFETNDVNVGWNGSYAIANPEYYAQVGIYSWRVVVYSETTTERRELTGHVQLMR